MKIVESDLSLASQHSKNHEIFEKESLTQWSRPEDAPQRLQNRDRLELSEELKVLEDETTLDPKLQSMVRALEFLMGRKIDISFAKRFSPQEANTPQRVGWGIDYSYERHEVKEESLAESSIDDEDVNNIWKEDTANVEDHGVVLLVDEEPPTRTHCLSVLENNFFEVDVATDGLRALEMVKERKYDAILASRALPGIDGIELTKLVRKMEADEEAALPPPKFGEKPRKVQRVPMIAFTDMAKNGEASAERRDARVSAALTEP